MKIEGYDYDPVEIHEDEMTIETARLINDALMRGISEAIDYFMECGFTCGQCMFYEQCNPKKKGWTCEKFLTKKIATKEWRIG